MSFHYKKQVWLILLGLVIVAGLLSLDLKPPLVNNAKEKNHQETHTQVSFDEQLEKSKTSLDQSTLSTINKLEEEWKADKKNSDWIEKLAKTWEKTSAFGISGYYYQMLADNTPNAVNYIRSGSLFTKAFKSEKDSALFGTYILQAENAYKQALQLDSGNLEAKCGLAVCYVEGSQNPMQGIMLLREVIKKDPENEAANLNLGLFSMKSGQFEKAIERFKTLTKKHPSIDSYALLAEAYEKVGDNKNAISTLEKAKTFTGDASVKEGIDNYIKSLNK